MNQQENDRIEKFKFMVNIPACNSVCLNTLALIDTGYFTAPASLRHHGQNEGDLFYHSLQVAENLCDLTLKNELEWQREASPIIVGLFHDLCKADDYICTGMEDGKTIWEWNKKSIYTGHGEKSVLMAAPIILLTEEEVACIRWHMGPYDDKENWSRYGAAIEKYPNVLWTHHADMMSAKIQKI